MAFTYPETFARRCSVKNVFLKFFQNSKENTCTRASLLIKLQASGLFYRTPTVAAFPNSGYLHCVILKALDAFQEKERVSKQRTCNFFFKMVQMRLSRFLKRLETT